MVNNLNVYIENIIFYFKQNYQINLKVFDFLLIFVIGVFVLKQFHIFAIIISFYFSQDISFKLAKKILINSFWLENILINNRNSSYYKNTIIVDILLFISSVVQPLFFLISDALILTAILLFLFYSNALISFYLLLFISLTCLIFYLYLRNKLFGEI